MSKMLLITDKFGPHTGGTAVIYSNWCCRMDPQEVVVLTCPLPWAPGWKEFDSEQNFRIYRVPFINIPKIRMPLVWLFLLFAAPFVIMKERPTIIHSGHAIETGFACAIMKWLFRRKYVVHTYGEEIKWYSSGKYRALRQVLVWALRQADVITTISTYTQSNLVKLGIPREKIMLLYPGVDLEKFQRIPDLSKLRDKYQLNGRKILLTVARLLERKGNDMVIRALPRVLKQVPNLVYLIVGEGREEEKLRFLVKRLNLGKHVVFVGRIPNDQVPQYYYLCDIFIMPNRMVESTKDVEGFGIVFLEANACDKPVIGGKSGGAVDAIIDGATGLLVEPTSLDKIVSAILKLIADDRLASAMGQKGRKRVEDEFTWDVPVRKIQALNRKLTQLK